MPHRGEHMGAAERGARGKGSPRCQRVRSLFGGLALLSGSLSSVFTWIAASCVSRRFQGSDRQLSRGAASRSRHDSWNLGAFGFGAAVPSNRDDRPRLSLRVTVFKMVMVQGHSLPPSPGQDSPGLPLVCSASGGQRVNGRPPPAPSQGD